MALETQTEQKHDQQQSHQQRNQQHHHNQQPQQQQQFRQRQLHQQEQQQQQQQLETSRTDEDDEQIEEIGPVPYRTIYDTVYEIAEKFAGTSIGQFVIGRFDRALRTIEMTAKWSLPEDKSSDAKLERPLSWLPFLMLIITLRLARIWFSIAALLIGNGPVTSYDTVYFIQTRRRKLRSLRVHGLKEIQRRETEETSTMQSNQSRNSLLKKFQNFMSNAFCRPGHHREPVRRIFIQCGKPVAMDKLPEDRPNAKRPRDEEDSDLNLTVEQMLTKYANQDSDEDSDFIPNPEDESLDDADEETSDSDKETEKEKMKPKTNGDSSSVDDKPTNTKNINSKSENNNIGITKKTNNNEHETSKIAENKLASSSELETANEQQQQLQHLVSTNNESNPAKQSELDVAKNLIPSSKVHSLNDANRSAAQQHVNQAMLQMHGPPTTVKRQFFSSIGASAASSNTQAVVEADDGTNFHNSPPTASLLNYSPSSSSSFLFSSTPSTSDGGPFSSTPSSSQNSRDTTISNADEEISQPSTPTFESATSNSESSVLPSASSSEDLFFSPIGSPPDFNAYMQRQAAQTPPTLSNPIHRSEGTSHNDTDTAHQSERAFGMDASSGTALHSHQNDIQVDAGQRQQSHKPFHHQNNRNHNSNRQRNHRNRR